MVPKSRILLMDPFCVFSGHSLFLYFRNRGDVAFGGTGRSIRADFVPIRVPFLHVFVTMVPTELDADPHTRRTKSNAMSALALYKRILRIARTCT